MEGVEFTINFSSKNGRSRIYYHCLYQEMEGVEFTIIFLIKKVRVVEFPMNLEIEGVEFTINFCFFATIFFDLRNVTTSKQSR